MCVGVEGNLSASEFLDSNLPSFLTFQVVCQIIKRMAKLGRILVRVSSIIIHAAVVHTHVMSCTCCVLEKKEEMSSRAVILK